jgi:GNAT superfamily N-acetyltransferase
VEYLNDPGDSKTLYLAAARDGKIAGMLVYFRDLLVIHAIYVRPEYRRQGIARELYEQALAVEPGLKFDTLMTAEGEMFARAVGWNGVIRERLHGSLKRKFVRKMLVQLEDTQRIISERETVGQ